MSVKVVSRKSLPRRRRCRTVLTVPKNFRKIARAQEVVAFLRSLEGSRILRRVERDGGSWIEAVQEAEGVLFPSTPKNCSRKKR